MAGRIDDPAFHVIKFCTVSKRRLNVFVSSRMSEVATSRKIAVEKIFACGHIPRNIDNEPNLADEGATQSEADAESLRQMNKLLDRSDTLILIYWLSAGNKVVPCKCLDSENFIKVSPIAYEVIEFYRRHRNTDAPKKMLLLFRSLPDTTLDNPAVSFKDPLEFVSDEFFNMLRDAGVPLEGLLSSTAELAKEFEDHCQSIKQSHPGAKSRPVTTLKECQTTRRRIFCVNTPKGVGEVVEFFLKKLSREMDTNVHYGTESVAVSDKRRFMIRYNSPNKPGCLEQVLKHLFYELGVSVEHISVVSKSLISTGFLQCVTSKSDEIDYFKHFQSFAEKDLSGGSSWNGALEAVSNNQGPDLHLFTRKLLVWQLKTCLANSAAPKEGGQSKNEG